VLAINQIVCHGAWFLLSRPPCTQVWETTLHLVRPRMNSNSVSHTWGEIQSKKFSHLDPQVVRFYLRGSRFRNVVFRNSKRIPLVLVSRKHPHSTIDSRLPSWRHFRHQCFAKVDAWRNEPVPAFNSALHNGRTKPETSAADFLHCWAIYWSFYFQNQHKYHSEHEQRCQLTQ